MSTQLSQTNIVEQPPKNWNSDSNNSYRQLVEATGGSASQQQPQAVTMLKPISTNTLKFDSKNDNFEILGDNSSQHL